MLFMTLRKIFHVPAFLSLVIAFFAPVKLACAAGAASSAAVTSKDAVVKLHWLGKKSISADTNSQGLITIWSMPESAKLEAQFIDKACAAPWHLFHQPADSNSANLLHPLVLDLIEQESYLEIRRTTNSPAILDEMVLAIRLTDERAAAWQTNLAVVMQAFTGITPVNDPSAHRWALKKHHAPNLIESVRAGSWLVIGAAQDHNALLDETLARIEKEHVPYQGSKSKFWVDATVAPARLPDSLGGGAGNHFSELSFTITGDGENILTHGEITLSSKTPVALAPWNIPTNLICDDFTSFTAVRGVKPWLASSPIWADLKSGSPPDQLFIWAPQGFPMETYFAAPLADASNQVSRITQLTLEKHASPRLAKALEGFQKAQGYNGLSWRGFPFFGPFLQSIKTNDGNFVLGGFFHFDPPQNKLSVGTVNDILGRTNLVYYDRELAGSRIEQWLYLGQAIRFASGGSQLPSDSPWLVWFKAVVPRFGPCGTEITQTGPGALSLARKSKVGFTAVELHLLADWLESAEFPCGIYSSSPPAEQ
jgi:hypothetical protein